MFRKLIFTLFLCSLGPLAVSQPDEPKKKTADHLVVLPRSDD